jgi:hypothetical protein
MGKSLFLFLLVITTEMGSNARSLRALTEKADI